MGNTVKPLDKPFLRALSADSSGRPSDNAKLNHDRLKTKTDGLLQQPVDGQVNSVEDRALTQLAKNSGVGDPTIARVQQALANPGQRVAFEERSPEIEKAAARFPKWFDFNSMKQTSSSCGCGPVMGLYRDKNKNLMMLQVDGPGFGQKGPVKVQASFAKAEEVGADSGAWVKRMHDQPQVKLSKPAVQFMAEQLYSSSLRDAREQPLEAERSFGLGTELSRSKTQPGDLTPAGIDLKNLGSSVGGVFSRDNGNRWDFPLKDKQGVSFYQKQRGGDIEIGYWHADSIFSDKREETPRRLISQGEAAAFKTSQDLVATSNAMWQSDFDTHKLLAVIAQDWGAINK
jgi:hypothetical protein